MEQTIYVFYGDDPYIIKSKTSQLIAKHQIDDFNVTIYDLEEQDIEEAVNDALTIPFMSDTKAVIVKNAFLLTSEKPKSVPNQNETALQRFLENPPQETLFIIQVPYAKIDERKAIVKSIKKVGEVILCEPLKAADQGNWVKRQLGKHSISIDRNALEELLKRTNSDTEILVSETQKLLLYAENLTNINLEIIKKVITKNVEDNVYEITNMILENNQGKALEIYNDLVMHSEDPLRILGILITKYREILHTKLLLQDGKDKADVATYFNASSGRAYYIMKNANSVRLETVHKHLESLEDLDYKIKTGQIDKNIGLELFILGT